MKLIKQYLLFILTLYASEQVFAQNVEHFEVTESSIELIDLISQLEKKYDLNFRYKYQWVENQIVSVEVRSSSLEDLLSQIFNPLSLSFIILDNDLVVLLKDGQQKISIQKEDINNQIIGIGNVVLGLNEATLSGQITDEDGKSPLPGVVIYSKDRKHSTISKIDGRYNIIIPVGLNEITFQLKGHSSRSFTIKMNSSGEFNISMYEDILQLDEIVISAEEQDDISETLAGKTTMTIKEIKSIPAMFGEVDIVRSILTLPGVSTAGEGASGFNVRGGTTSQNLVLLDGGVLYNPSHLFGFFSAVSSDAISSIDLHKGAIPVEYAGRISSALDINLKSGNKEKVHGSGGISYVSSKFNIEVPIVKEKSSISTATRVAYPTYLIRRVEDADFRRSSAFFGDISVKYDHLINEKNLLSASAYVSQDFFTLSDQAVYEYGNRIATLKWINNASALINSEHLFNYSAYEYAVSDNSELSRGYSMEAVINDYKWQSNFELSHIKQHRIKFGISAIHHSLQPGIFTPEDSTLTDEIILDEENGTEFGLYVSDKYQLANNLSIYGGIRYSLFTGGKRIYESTSHGMEPRISINYQLNFNTSLKLGYNRMRQFMHLISNTTAVTPIDSWKLSNTEILPSIGDQISLGYFRNIDRKKYEIIVEGYFKAVQNLLEYKNGANLFRNENIEEELVQGLGNSYGLELSLKKNSGKINGWINYTFSRSLIRVESNQDENEINHGNWFPTNFDQPHNLNIFTNITLSRRFNLSTNYQYNTGRPFTKPVTSYFIFDAPVAHFDVRNNSRIPDYHRLDLTIFMGTSLKKVKKVEANWALSIYNVYARKNVYSVFFRKSSNSTEAYKFIVIGRPLVSLAYNFKF